MKKVLSLTRGNILRTKLWSYLYNNMPLLYALQNMIYLISTYTLVHLYFYPRFEIDISSIMFLSIRKHFKSFNLAKCIQTIQIFMINQNLVTVTKYYMQCCVKAISVYNFNITRSAILLTFHNNKFIFMAL